MDLDCKHENLRQTVMVVVNLPIGSNKLDKKAIRSKDVRIDAVLWDHIRNYTYCADCGLVMDNPESFIGGLADITTSTNKIERIKAVREMTYCGLKEAKYFVDVAFEDYGQGDPLPILHDMTTEDVKRIVNNRDVKQYQSILENWGK